MFQNNWKVNIKKSVNSKELLQSDLWDERGVEGEGCCGKASILRVLLKREKLIVGEEYKINFSRKSTAILGIRDKE